MVLSVLVLCTGNSCRSQMAEGILNHYGKEILEAFSAGTHPSTLNPLAIKAMEEININISHHTSKGVRTFERQEFNFVITVCDRAKGNCPSFPTQTQLIHWNFDDPAEAEGSDEDIMNEFRRIRNEIQAKIEIFLDSLTAG